MAKVKFTPTVLQVRGRVGNWVYRKSHDACAISVLPDITDKGLSPAQAAVRTQFHSAVDYAKTALADPVLETRYRDAAKLQDVPVFAYILGEFFSPPTVSAVDPSGYHGQVGDTIVVRADARFEVAEVQVTIRSAANAVLEQGPAALVNAAWHYPAKTAVAAGTAVTIEVVAKDHPGHTGTMNAPYVIA